MDAAAPAPGKRKLLGVSSMPYAGDGLPASALFGLNAKVPKLSKPGA